MSANPEDVAAVDGEATPADPGTIDLEEITQRYFAATFTDKGVVVSELIAAVEALRARVAELQKIKDNWIEAGKLRGERADQAEARTEAAEAHEKELARLIQVILDVADGATVLDTWRREARATLAATPDTFVKKEKKDA